MNDLLKTVESGLRPVFEYGMIRNIQFLIYGMFLMFVFYSCQSTTTPRLPEKLDLANEKQIISEATDIPEAKKRLILDTFEKSENYCNNIILTMNDLYKIIEKQKAEIKTLDEQARIYRMFRNAAIVIILLLLVWQTSNIWLPIAKRLIGMP